MIKLSLIFKFWKFKIKTKLFSDKKINNTFDCVKVCVLNTELWSAEDLNTLSIGADYNLITVLKKGTVALRDFFQ